MKWNAWIFMCGVAAIAMASGCSSKDQQQAASTSSAPASGATGAASAAPAATVAKSSSGAASPRTSNANSDSGASESPPASKPASAAPGSGMGLGGVSAMPPPGFGASTSLGMGPGTGAPSPSASMPKGSLQPSVGLGGGGAIPGAMPTGAMPPGALSAANTPPPLIELSLRDRAVNAFKAGNGPRAYALFQAHALSVSSDEVESLMENFRWDKKRIVPRFGYNFAVGLILNTTTKIDDLKPIGTPLESLRGSAAGGGRAGGGLGMGLGGASNATGPKLPARELDDAAGKFASKFVEAFASVHSDGKWSEAFREYELGGGRFTQTGLSGAPSGLPKSFGGMGGATLGAGGLSGPPAGYSGGAGAAPPGYGTAGGPPPGYSGGPGGGAPPGYGASQGGPPAGYRGGGNAGAPPGYGDQGGPPAGYRGGGNAGAPPGYGDQNGPPEGYRGGSNSGPPAGYGGSSGPPAASPPGRNPVDGEEDSDKNDSSSLQPMKYAEPQDEPSFSGIPGAGGIMPGAGAGFANNAAAAGYDPALLKELQLPAGTIPLGPGLNYIGKGESVGELSKQAIEGDYDALIVFEVDVSLLRVNNTIKNDCRIRVINLRADKDSKDKAITSSSLNNREVASDKDPDAKIDSAIEVLMKKMFDAYPLDDLPKFTSESIEKKRLKDLENDKKRSPLDLLTEIELYASKGLIDDSLKLEAFEKIAGPDGKILATGTPEEKLPIVEKMVRRRFD